MNRLVPRQTIGILGGGQLGRMAALAAAELGLRTLIYQPEREGPAFDVATECMTGDYEDAEALARFAARCDVITYEFENVPARTVEILAPLKPVRPGARMLSISQDRLHEKTFMSDLGIETAPFWSVDSLTELEVAVLALGRPSVLKTRRFGYDGKGQVVIRPDTALPAAYDAIGGAPAILEGFVPFSAEVSVIAARGLDGTFAAYDVCENEHRNHILWQTNVPARISPETQARALDIARRIGDGLDAVGVFAVEMFLLRDGGSERLIVNEIAPRVHNSGHWTIEGAETSQFEQHIRAIAGWPLGSVACTGASVTMQNLIGDEAGDWARLLAEPGAHLHLYGKSEPRPGRKMGHVTRVRRHAG
ncbi:MAG TPA: 5-(carboxyamino)imidazole ribonucleotide synthase [Beijerinckiaceae bacterium]|nr:5-(carboxyamino)imidazole ribonucleotide synthase [Beijerinckiaceae bacterium]